MRLPTVPFTITILLFALTTVGVAVFINSKAQSQLATTVSAKTIVQQTTDNVTLDYASPNGWQWYEQALKDIGSLGDGQTIELGVVTDPAQTHLHYFATSASDNKLTMISIYRYDSLTLSFERLYRGTYKKGEEPHLGKNGFPVLHVVGYIDGQLLVVLRDSEYTLAKCEEPLLFAINDTERGAILALTLNDPASGLRDYTASEEIVAKAKTKAAHCQTAE